MYQVNDDMSIYVTRGDIVNLAVTAEDNGEPYIFHAGDMLRIKVFAKKDCEVVVLQKDFPVTSETDTVDIFLDENDTKIGEVISKPKDYWYEIELNPLTNPQTIIGYDEDGTKVFRLFPEGRDLTENDPVIMPEDVPVVDTELSLNSKRPVENQVVTRALYRLDGTITRNAQELSAFRVKSSTDIKNLRSEISTERERISNLIAAESTEGELVDLRVGADGRVYNSAGDSMRGQIGEIAKNYAIGEKTENIFNRARAQLDKYVSYENGNIGVAAGYFVTDIIPVEAGEKYYAARYLSDGTAILPITKQQVAFYDAERKYISGVVENTFPIVVPENSAYMRMNGKAEHCDEFFIGQTLPVHFEAYGNYVTSAKVKNFVTDYDKINLPVVTGQKSPNIINPTKLFKDRYVHYIEGKSSVADGFCHTDFINVDGHTKIYAHGVTKNDGDTQTAFYDETFTFISGVLDLSADGVEIPQNAKYARITLPLNKEIMVTFDEFVSRFIPYGAYLPGVGGFDETVLTVGASKQFTSLREAVNACVNPAPYNRYVIEFYGDGKAYDVLADFTEEEIARSGFIGLTIPAYTILRGMGNRADNILTCSINSGKVSTINTTTSASLENMTMYAYNCRYVVHADYPDHINAEGHFYNCHFIGKDLSYGSVCGTGLRSGAKWHIKDCIFDNLSGDICFSTHNNVGFVEPATIELENCRMNTTRSHGIRIGSLNTNCNGIVNRIKIVGCKTAGIHLIEENADKYGKGILFELSGYGNDVKTATIINTDNKDYSRLVSLI